MGEGVQQRRGRHRFGEAYAGDGPETLLAEKMDSGAHLRLVGPEQEAEQRLREAAGERRSLHLRCHESSDGEEIGSLMRVFRQFQGEVRHAPLPRPEGPTPGGVIVRPVGLSGSYVRTQAPCSPVLLKKSCRVGPRGRQEKSRGALGRGISEGSRLNVDRMVIPKRAQAHPPNELDSNFLSNFRLV